MCAYFKHLISNLSMVFTLIAKFIETIKSFFKKDPVFIRTNVAQIPMLIEKNFLLKKHELEDLSAKNMAQVKYLQGKAKNLLNTISTKELEGKENERMNKAGLTSKRQLETQMKRVLEKIDPTERGTTINDARHYYGESYAILVNEVMAFRKNIVYTSFYLKDEMKSFGEVLQELLNLYNEMNVAFSKEKDFFEYEKIKEKIGSSIKKKKEIDLIIKEKSENEEKIANKEKELESQGEKMLSKRAGKEMVELKKLEEELTKLTTEKQDLKTEISALLINIDRPLARFKQLVDSGRWKVGKEEKEMLDLFITNPILALKKDPRAEIFKRVLGEIIKAVEEGAVELKDKEKEKRLSALQEIINFDFFGKVFWKMNELQKRQIELNKELEKSAIKKDIEKEEKKSNELERELIELKEKRDLFDKRIATQKEESEKELNEVKAFAEKVLGKTIIFDDEAI
jgi:hypothetical protein